jgi:hypothetical protein
MDWQSLKEFGFVGVVFAGFMFVLRWVFGNVERQQNSWNIIQREWAESLNKHTEQAKDFHAEVKATNEYHRKEHEAIITLATSILDCANKIAGRVGVVLLRRQYGFWRYGS